VTVDDSAELDDFDAFVVARGASLLRLAWLLCGRAHAAEDLVQEALARAYLRWDRVVAAQAPEAYVRRILVNEYVTNRRRRGSGELPRGDLGPGAALPDTADAGAARDEMWRLLARLPRTQRAVLVLRYYEDQSDEQIATVLGCGPSTVRSNAARGLATLRGIVGSVDEETLP
jgi:RNA polymerase sigma-70 factor (sigma-E family)